MIITHNIGSLAAELKLALLSSISGLIVHDALQWHLRSLAENKEKTHNFDEAMAFFAVEEGEYAISATYLGETLEFGTINLVKNTRTDMLFIFANSEWHDSEDYFSDYDASLDFPRRQRERDLQSKFGFSTLPLRNPNNSIQGEYGSQIMAHPLLKDSVQFDGIPPEIRPDPSENREALQLTLAQRLSAAPGAAATPTLIR